MSDYNKITRSDAYGLASLETKIKKESIDRTYRQKRDSNLKKRYSFLEKDPVSDTNTASKNDIVSEANTLMEASDKYEKQKEGLLSNIKAAVYSKEQANMLATANVEYTSSLPTITMTSNDSWKYHAGYDPVGLKKEIPLNKDEELIINIEELADELAEEALKNKDNILKYSELLNNYKKIILKHERRNKEE